MCTFQDDPARFDIRAIMSLNTFFATDISTLLFGNIAVIFDFPFCTKPRNLLPAMLCTVLTSVTLPATLGAIYNAFDLTSVRGRGVIKWYCDRLVRLGMSIRFLARNCPQLQRLTVQPHHASVIRCKFSILEVVARALGELVKKVEGVAVVRIEYSGLQEEGGWEENCDSEKLEVMVKRPKFENVTYTFKAQEVPAYLREDEVMEWAMDVLRELRGQRCEADIMRGYQELLKLEMTKG